MTCCTTRDEIVFTPMGTSSVNKGKSERTPRPSHTNWLSTICGLFGISVFLLFGANTMTADTTKLQTPNMRMFLHTNKEPSLSLSDATNKNDTRVDWIKNLILKPALLEVGGVVFFQFLGMPAINQATALLRRVPARAANLGFWRGFGARGLRPLVNASRRVLNTGRTAPSKLSSFLQRFRRAVGTMYRKRSRLSVASDFANYVGLDEENNNTENAEKDARK